MPHSSVFVGRGLELSRLNTYLENALAGQGSICLITGNAGSGKTALVTAFTKQALNVNKKLIAAVGMADATTGAGDAYLPFREILAQLTGDVDAKLSQGAITRENASRLRNLLGLSGEAIAELGPDLIGIFIPGAGLVARAAAFAVDKAGWLDKLTKRAEKADSPGKPFLSEIAQANIFEQYTNVIRILSSKHPLVLILDDLHWADTASCELLFHLARRIQGYPILILGTYRPEEIAVGRQGEHHPLEKIINELKRYFGDIFIELDQIPTEQMHAFVDALIDSEPNLLGEDFRMSLFKLANGHPLFTIELLLNMQERGDLIQDEHGNWVTSPVLNWNHLPNRVEGVIEERLSRLVEEQRRTLTIGSVEGETFTAEIIARLQSIDLRNLIRNLSGELEKKHRLVAAQGIQNLPTGRISMYRFQHNLFQRYLYHDLDAVERTYLHEDVGRIMEELFNGDTERVAVQLAHHYDQANLPEKALPYLYSAGMQAMDRFANHEALHYFIRALGLVSKDDMEMQYKLHMNFERIYNLFGDRPKQKQELDILDKLCAGFGEPIKQAEVDMRTAGYMESIGEYQQAITAIERSLTSAKASDNSIFEARIHHKWGYILWRTGNYQEGLIHLEKALALATAGGNKGAEADALREMGVIHWRQGEHPKAEDYYQHALSIYKELDDQRGECITLSGLGNLYLRQDRYEQAEEKYQQALKLVQQAGNKRGELVNLGNLGIIAALQGNFSQAYDRFNQILIVSSEINDRESEGRAFGNLGGLMLDIGWYDRAKEYLSDAVEIFSSIGNQTGSCWILADRGLCYLRLNLLDQALEDCNSAFTIAEQIGNKHFQNTARAHRAHVELLQNKYEEAYADYQSSLLINIELGDLTGELEALAGLATLAQTEGDLNQALIHAEQIWKKFDPSQVRDTECRSHLLLTCYHVFNQVGDQRKIEALQKAYRLVMQQAGKLENEEIRHSFLTNVQSNYQICGLVDSGFLDR